VEAWIFRLRHQTNRITNHERHCRPSTPPKSVVDNYDTVDSQMQDKKQSKANCRRDAIQDQTTWKAYVLDHDFPFSVSSSLLSPKKENDIHWSGTSAVHVVFLSLSRCTVYSISDGRCSMQGRRRKKEQRNSEEKQEVTQHLYLLCVPLPLPKHIDHFLRNSPHIHPLHHTTITITTTKIWLQLSHPLLRCSPRSTAQHSTASIFASTSIDRIKKRTWKRGRKKDNIDMTASFLTLCSSRGTVQYVLIRRGNMHN